MIYFGRANNCHFRDDVQKAFIFNAANLVGRSQRFVPLSYAFLCYAASMQKMSVYSRCLFIENANVVVTRFAYNSM